MTDIPAIDIPPIERFIVEDQVVLRLPVPGHFKSEEDNSSEFLIETTPLGIASGMERAILRRNLESRIRRASIRLRKRWLALDSAFKDQPVPILAIREPELDDATPYPKLSRDPWPDDDTPWLDDAPVAQSTDA